MKRRKKNAKKKPSPQTPSQAPARKAVDERRSEDAGETEMKKERAIHALADAFCSASLDEAAMAYDEAGGDVHRAAEILAVEMLESSDAPSTSSVSGDASSSGSGSGSSEGFPESLVTREADFGRSKQKRLVAATGLVSTVIGRHYAVPSPKKSKLKGFDNGVKDREGAEQFLCSMLGDESELNLAVVRDVYCQCGYDVDKALDALLNLTASFNGQSEETENNNLVFRYGDEILRHNERSETLTDRVSECSSHSSEYELHDSIWSVGYGCRKNYAEVLAGTAHSPNEKMSDDSHHPQKLLESFFNISKSREYRPSTMNWRHVARKLQSLGSELDVCPTNHPAALQVTYVEGNEYEALREPANAQWESVKSCYEKASSAYSKGARHYAAYLSDQGQVKTKLAREADERASKDIFVARNKDIQNVITIDLHGQHVKEAMRMLKMHLLLVSYVQTVQILRVITGCGTHGMGRSKVKQSAVRLLDNEGISWTEENRGTVLVKLCGQREFSFLDCESDAE